MNPNKFKKRARITGIGVTEQYYNIEILDHEIW